MRVFGLLIDWVSSSYHQEIWVGVQAFCRERGVNLLTLVTGRPGSPFQWEQMRNQLLEFLDGRRFDGFLFMTATLGNHLDQEQFRQLLDRVAPAPVVSLGAGLDGVPSIQADNETGFREILNHLYQAHGHRRFAYIGGPEYNYDARERDQFLSRFLHERGLSMRPEHRLAREFGTVWGKEAVERLIPGDKPDFDVLVCGNDDIAIGALEALTLKGLQVPGDLALTGFDDIRASGLAALTTARQPLNQLGWTAAAQLWDRLEGRNVGLVTKLPSALVLRQSCGCLSPAARLAQVEPRSNSPFSFAEREAEQREQLLKDLAGEGLPAIHALALRDQFLDSWKKQDSASFQHGVQKILAGMAARSLPPGHLHYPLSVLRHWVLQAAEPAEHRAFIEATIHQARILLTDVLHTQAVQKETRQLLLKDQLSDLNQKILYSRNFHDQAAILLEVFPRLGISAFRLSLYNDVAQPMASARLVLTEKGELTPGLTYDPKLIFTPEFPEPAEPWSYVAEALFDRNAPLGFFLLDSRGDASLLEVFDQLCERVGRGVETLRRIHDLEQQVALRTSELSRALEHLEANNVKLKEMALKDELSGLHNRRGFVMLAEHLLSAHRRNGRPLVLFFADLDGLKTVNDTWGHNAGDEAIRTCSRVLSETFRDDDVVARFGGDEFAVLAPECSTEDAPGLAARAAAAVENLSGGRYGLSTGWVAIAPRASFTLGDWMREADQALYRDKLARKSALRRSESPEIPK